MGFPALCNGMNPIDTNHDDKSGMTMMLTAEGYVEFRGTWQNRTRMMGKILRMTPEQIEESIRKTEEEIRAEAQGDNVQN